MHRPGNTATGDKPPVRRGSPTNLGCQANREPGAAAHTRPATRIPGEPTKRVPGMSGRRLINVGDIINAEACDYQRCTGPDRQLGIGDLHLRVTYVSPATAALEEGDWVTLRGAEKPPGQPERPDASFVVRRTALPGWLEQEPLVGGEGCGERFPVGRHSAPTRPASPRVVLPGLRTPLAVRGCPARSDDEFQAPADRAEALPRHAVRGRAVGPQHL